MSSATPDRLGGGRRRPSPPAYPWAVSLHRGLPVRTAEGSGLVISQRQVLTCRHVVAPDSDSAAPPDSSAVASWWVVCHQHRPRPATIAVERIYYPSEDSLADLALLDLVADVPAGITPANLAWIDPHDLVEEGWWAFGHPGGDLFGNTARGYIGDALGYGVVRLDLDTTDDPAGDRRGERIAAGFSGAGLWSPTHKAVVAVVTEHGPGGGGRAITLTEAVTHLPHAVFADQESAADLALPRDTAAAADVPGEQPLGRALPLGTIIGAVPIRPKEWIERPGLLTGISDALDGPSGLQPNADAVRRVATLSGPGGAGKTQLAGQYARSLSDTRQAVVAWLAAETTTGVREDYAELGRRLGVALPGEDSSVTARKTVAYLTDTTTPILLVFDNADDVNVIEPYIPRSGHCRVLITTRSGIRGSQDDAFSDLGPVIRVGGVDRQTTVDYLSNQAGLTPADAGRAADYLAGLPLALTAAVDVVRAQRSATNASQEALGDIISKTIIAGRGAITDPSSYPVLDVDAPLHGDPLGAVLVVALRAAVDAIPGALSVLQAFVTLSPDGVSPDLLRRVVPDGAPRAIDQLKAAGLVIDSTGGLLTIHRLTAAAIARQYQVTLPESRQRIVMHLYPLIPDRDANPILSPLDTEVVRHTREIVATLGVDTDTEFAASVAQLGNRASRLLRISGDFSGMVSLATQLAEMLERVLGPEHPDTLTSRSNLATAYSEVGRAADAVILNEQTLAVRERVLGPEHPDTLTSRSNLAVAYYAVGRAVDAVTLNEQTLAVRERVLGPEHPDTLKSRNNLANAYSEVGRAADAVTLNERTLAVRERVQGPEHPDTLTSRSNLAIAYSEVGRAADAVTLDEQTLAVRERVLGPEHPDTLTSRSNLAVAYYAVGRAADAATLNEQTLAVWERVQGPEHPDTLSSRSNLAVAYCAVGRAADAVTLNERTLAVRERVLGPEHPDTLTSRSNLAVAYSEVGRAADAVILDERTLAVRERVLGPEHPDTLKSRNNLANAYYAVGRAADAVTLNEQTLAVRERVLGPEHPDTLTSRNNLAVVYRAVRRQARARRVEHATE